VGDACKQGWGVTTSGASYSPSRGARSQLGWAPARHRACTNEGVIVCRSSTSRLEHCQLQNKTFTLIRGGQRGDLNSLCAGGMLARQHMILDPRCCCNRSASLISWEQGFLSFARVSPAWLGCVTQARGVVGWFTGYKLRKRKLRKRVWKRWSRDGTRTEIESSEKTIRSRLPKGLPPHQLAWWKGFTSP